MARSERVRESTDFLRSLPFRPDIILKKRVQNDTACLLPGGLQNWSRAIVSTELTQCPGDPHDWSSVQQAGGQAGRIGALRGRLNRFIFTHCERSDGSSVLASELTHQAVPPEHEVTTQCPAAASARAARNCPSRARSTALCCPLLSSLLAFCTERLPWH